MITHQIHHVDDSYAVLADLDPDSVDHIITDPPYDAHCQANQMSGTTLAKVDLPFAPLAAYTFAQDMVRVARRWALSFGTVESLGEYKRAVGDSYVRGGIWYKPNSMGQLTGDRPAAAYEALAIMHRPVKQGQKKRWNGRGSFAFWACNGTRGEKDRHPNQKPLALCLELVAKFTDPGETILDPFCGSGRIGEACMLLGRNYIGFDSDPCWVQRAEGACTLARMAYEAQGPMVLELNTLRLDKTGEEFL